MKNFVRFLLVAFVGLLLTGCMEVESLIKVKADGSGTINQTVLMGSGLANMMKNMGDAMGGDTDKAKKKGSPLLDEEKLKEAALKMGEGVTFVSAAEHKSDTGEGYIATYAFTDINKLMMDQNPGSSAPSGGGDDKKTEPIRFIFAKGKTSTLTIKSMTRDAVKEGEKEAASKDDKEKEPAAQSEEEKASEEMAMGMMKQMFQGMRVAMIVEIDGEIIETNATHREGSRITIMDMDFGAMMANEEAFKEFAASKDQSIENAKNFMKDIPGIKIDMNDEITIKFK